MPQVEIIMPTKSLGEARPTRIAAYCRVSSNSDDQLNSFYAQVKYYTTRVDELPNSELVDIYADEGISGSTISKRTDFQRMLADCDKGKVDRIITKTVSRFARNTLDCLETVRSLKAKGVSVYFEEQNIDTEKMSDEMLITMYGNIAQNEAKSISKNLKFMNRKRMADGCYVSRMAPYGYKYEDRTYIVCISHALVVRRIFREYLKGHGAAAISNLLNDEGIAPPERAKRWYPNTIYGILRNEKYVGDTRFQKTFREDDLPFTKRINKGQLESYYVENTHMPIVEREVFELVQELMNDRSAAYATGPAVSSAMRNILLCGNCGGKMKRKVVRDKPYWVCYHHNIRKEYCETPPIGETDIEDAFVVMFNKLKANSKHIIAPVIQNLTKLQNSLRKENARLVDIDKSLVQLNDKKLLLTKLHSKEIMDDTTYLNETAIIDEEISKLSDERRKMLSTDADLEQISQVKELQSLLNSTETLMRFDPVVFRAMVACAIIHDKNNIEFKLFGGLSFPERLGRSAE